MFWRRLPFSVLPADVGAPALTPTPASVGDTKPNYDRLSIGVEPADPPFITENFEINDKFDEQRNNIEEA